MKDDHRLRRLVDGDTVWLWSVRQKVDRDCYENCRTTLSLHREGSRSRLLIVFRPGPNRAVSNTYFDAGSVGTFPEGEWLNLYEPKTVHRLLRTAAARGELHTEPRTREVDGWHLYETLMAAQNAEA
ncbi:hypothetical protein [Microtetraspora niveoalba]|uniref:hypothetical protein n=1 Tax=Microtetraspora niveoalba TaxID=46175 RepID=UPI00083368BD|nr:hypothetical protein [Microtetraspora niveoalba]